MDFLILPDASVSAPITIANAGSPLRCVGHASGRPWLVGHWSNEDITTVVAGTRRLVLFGHTRLDVAAATRVLAGARSAHDLDELARILPGSIHLLASIDGRIRAQGAPAGTRQIFYARIAGVTVAADRPRRLADLVGAHPDEEALAPRLLAPGTPRPPCTRRVWSGVEQLDRGCWLHIDTEGACRTVRRWQAPAAEAPLRQATETARAAIRDVVAVRTAGGRTVSADVGRRTSAPVSSPDLPPATAGATRPATRR